MGAAMDRNPPDLPFSQAGARRLPVPALLIAFCLWVAMAALVGAVAAVHFGSDADWDLRNYHLYNGFALLDGRFRSDLAPAQLQSYLAPGLDLIYDGLQTLLNRAPVVLAATLALPQGVAWFLTWCVARRMLIDTTPARDWTAALLVAIGATGVAGISTLSLAMSEMTASAFILGSLLLLLRAGSGAARNLAWAGVLAGISVGLKLTMSPYAIGLAGAAAVSVPSRPIRSVGWFGLGGGLGAMLTGGWWWAWLWMHYHNPVFPYFNEIFHSPWVLPLATTDNRYLPRTWLLAMAYPLAWGLEASRYVGEITMRDPRIALGGVAVLVILGHSLWRRRMLNRPAVVLLVVWVTSYWLWEARFSIYRYLATLELLTGPLIGVALAPLLARAKPRWSIPSLGAALIGLIAVSIYPNWGRTKLGPQAVAVYPPAFQPGSLVVLLEPSPMAYVAEFVPVSVRFVGANNNLIHPGVPGRLEREVSTAIRDQRGPLWGLEEDRLAANRHAANATLRAYGLARAPGCVRVRSNLDDDAILACPLIRTRAPLVRRTGPSPPAPADAASGRR